MNKAADELGQKICNLAGIDIYKNTRKQEYVDARSLFVFLLYNIHNYRLADIEKYFQSKGKHYNHATVLYAIRNFDNYRKFNKNLNEWLTALTDQDVDTTYKKTVILQNINTLGGEQIKQLYPIVKEMYEKELV